MTLFGKLEADLEIKSTAEKFHDIFNCRPHKFSNVSPKIVQSCDLLEGEWGAAGSVIYWTLDNNGKPTYAKDLMEAIDDENYSATFKVMEGDLLESYKNFKITSQATPKEGGGCVVHFTMEYEKLHADVPDPNPLMEFMFHLSKDIDAHQGQS